MGKVYMVYALKGVSEQERAEIEDAMQHHRLTSIARYHHVKNNRIYLDGVDGTIRVSVRA